MKEATGDLNMTLVVVVIVAILVASFSMYIWPLIKGGIKAENNCSDAICRKSPSTCPDRNGNCECTYQNRTIYCPYKG